MTEAKLCFSRLFLVIGNIALFLWVTAAFFAVHIYNQLLGWLYLVFLLFMVYVVLRRLGCGSCSKCKPCTKGFGRLAGMFFAYGFLKRESVKNRLDAVGLVYFLLLPLPILTMMLQFELSFSTIETAVLGTILFFSFLSFVTWSKTITRRWDTIWGKSFKRLNSLVKHGS